MPDSMLSTDPVSGASQPLLMAAARGACPQCGAATMFVGPVRFAPSCRACGLDLGQFNVGDGPAAFLTLIVGAVMVALALTLELKVHPPLWLHILLWTPLTVLAVVGSLRVAKAMLLILEYRNKAREGQLKVRERDQ
ncbi:DUF983 domain-containing protein [Sphingobium sp. EM0848]|uniref:DUF983 domain-containing protein n=1 Tax=Sphingobium sp. EM0848 TaxID=2743473 RepID=UPI00159C9AC4|nr:DUF983 domain-containing protein [Sphingobium sp. EM0848]